MVRFFFIVLFVVFGALWIWQNRIFLFDSGYQNEDASVFLIPFHASADSHSLLKDDTAREMNAFTTPGIYLIYRILTPIMGLQCASKSVQGICLLLIVLSGLILARSKHWGAPSGILLVILILETPLVANRIAGGFPRSFAFPFVCLWGALALAGNSRFRFLVFPLSALFYPPAALLLLAAEFWLIFVNTDIFKIKNVLPDFKKWGFVCLAAVILSTPVLWKVNKLGPTIPIKKTEKNPVFLAPPYGKEPVLPFPDLSEQSAIYFANPFTHAESFLPASIPKQYDWKKDSTVALLIIAGLILIVYLGLSPMPRIALALMLASLTISVLARVFAFKLYLPDLYSQFGMPVSAVLFPVEIVGSVGRGKASKGLKMMGHLFTVLLIFVVTGLLQNPSLEGEGLNMSRYQRASLYDYLQSLPVESRILAHPADSDAMTYWTGKPATVGLRQFQPLFTEIWEKQKARAFEALIALYAANREDVTKFCDYYGTTHLVLRDGRYGDDFKLKAHFFEPFNSFADELLKTTRREDLVFSKLPPEAVVFNDDSFKVVDLSLLEKAWGL